MQVYHLSTKVLNILYENIVSLALFLIQIFCFNKCGQKAFYSLAPSFQFSIRNWNFEKFTKKYQKNYSNQKSKMGVFYFLVLEKAFLTFIYSWIFYLRVSPIETKRNSATDLYGKIKLSTHAADYKNQTIQIVLWRLSLSVQWLAISSQLVSGKMIGTKWRKSFNTTTDVIAN